MDQRRLGGDGEVVWHVKRHYESTKAEREKTYLKRQLQYDRLAMKVCYCAIG